MERYQQINSSDLQRLPTMEALNERALNISTEINNTQAIDTASSTEIVKLAVIQSVE